MTRTHVLVMTKAPVAGKSKTRLCPPCSPVEAAQIAEAALADTLAAVAQSSADRKVVALDGEIGPWLPEGFEVFHQKGNTFNERLEHAWLTTGGPGLQIGMDTPQITASVIDRSIETTLSGPSTIAALGSATDGGWWALGLRSPQSTMFDRVPMSDSRTAYFQQLQLVALGYDIVALDELTDVDHVEDALFVAATAPLTKFAHLINDLQLEQRMVTHDTRGISR